MYLYKIGWIRPTLVFLCNVCLCDVGGHLIVFVIRGYILWLSILTLNVYSCRWPLKCSRVETWTGNSRRWSSDWMRSSKRCGLLEDVQSLLNVLFLMTRRWRLPSLFIRYSFRVVSLICFSVWASFSEKTTKWITNCWEGNWLCRSTHIFSVSYALFTN